MSMPPEGPHPDFTASALGRASMGFEANAHGAGGFDTSHTPPPSVSGEPQDNGVIAEYSAVPAPGIGRKAGEMSATYSEGVLPRWKRVWRVVGMRLQGDGRGRPHTESQGDQRANRWEQHAGSGSTVLAVSRIRGQYSVVGAGVDPHELDQNVIVTEADPAAVEDDITPLPFWTRLIRNPIPRPRVDDDQKADGEENPAAHAFFEGSTDFSFVADVHDLDEDQKREMLAAASTRATWANRRRGNPRHAGPAQVLTDRVRVLQGKGFTGGFYVGGDSEEGVGEVSARIAGALAGGSEEFVPERGSDGRVITYPRIQDAQQVTAEEAPEFFSAEFLGRIPLRPDRSVEGIGGQKGLATSLSSYHPEGADPNRLVKEGTVLDPYHNRRRTTSTVSFDPRIWDDHELYVGTTGSGKTVAVMAKASQYAAHGIPVSAIDFSQKDPSDWKKFSEMLTDPRIPEHLRSTVIIEPGNPGSSFFGIRPLIPVEGYPFTAHQTGVKALFIRSLMAGMHESWGGLITSHLNFLFEGYDPRKNQDPNFKGRRRIPGIWERLDMSQRTGANFYDGGHGPDPSMALLRQISEEVFDSTSGVNYQGTKSESDKNPKTIKEQLDRLLTGLMGDMLERGREIDPRIAIARNTVFLPGQIRDKMLKTFVSGLWLARMNQAWTVQTRELGPAHGIVRGVRILEEMESYGDGNSEMDDALNEDLRLSRTQGLKIIGVAQSLSRVAGSNDHPSPVASETGKKTIFLQNAPPDRDSAARILDLSAEDGATVTTLDRHQALFKPRGAPLTTLIETPRPGDIPRGDVVNVSVSTILGRDSLLFGGEAETYDQFDRATRDADSNSPTVRQLNFYAVEQTLEHLFGISRAIQEGGLSPTLPSQTLVRTFYQDTVGGRKVSKMPEWKRKLLMEWAVVPAVDARHHDVLGRVRQNRADIGSAVAAGYDEDEWNTARELKYQIGDVVDRGIHGEQAIGVARPPLKQDFTMISYQMGNANASTYTPVELLRLQLARYVDTNANATREVHPDTQEWIGPRQITIDPKEYPTGPDQLEGIEEFIRWKDLNTPGGLRRSVFGVEEPGSSQLEKAVGLQWNDDRFFPAFEGMLDGLRIDPYVAAAIKHKVHSAVAVGQLETLRTKIDKVLGELYPHVSPTGWGQRAMSAPATKQWAENTRVPILGAQGETKRDGTPITVEDQHSDLTEIRDVVTAEIERETLYVAGQASILDFLPPAPAPPLAATTPAFPITWTFNARQEDFADLHLERLGEVTQTRPFYTTEVPPMPISVYEVNRGTGVRVQYPPPDVTQQYVRADRREEPQEHPIADEARPAQEENKQLTPFHKREQRQENRDE